MMIKKLTVFIIFVETGIKSETFGVIRARTLISVLDLRFGRTQTMTRIWTQLKNQSGEREMVHFVNTGGVFSEMMSAAVRKLKLVSSVSTLALALALSPVHTDVDGLSFVHAQAIADDDGGKGGDGGDDDSGDDDSGDDDGGDDDGGDDDGGDDGGDDDGGDDDGDDGSGDDEGDDANDESDDKGDDANDDANDDDNNGGGSAGGGTGGGSTAGGGTTGGGANMGGTTTGGTPVGNLGGLTGIAPGVEAGLVGNWDGGTGATGGTGAASGL